MRTKSLWLIAGLLAVAVAFGCNKTVNPADGGPDPVDGGQDAGITYTLAVTTTGTGSVTLDPTGGISNPGTVVTLTAVPEAGWGFVRWEGDKTGSINPETITMDASKAVTAVFKSAPTPGGSGNLSMADAFNQYLAVKWAKATDAETSQADLQYRLYYSTSANIDTVTNVEANGTAACEWTKDIDGKPATTLLPMTNYYFNVLVKNGSEVKAAYTMTSTPVKTGNVAMSVVYEQVNSSVTKGDIVYLGGSFNEIGLPIVAGAILDTSMGSPVSGTLPQNISWEVRASVPDGKGGWFIGGGFTNVNGVERNNLAHINGDGMLYDWNPDADDTVYTLALSSDGATVYVGGGFFGIQHGSRGTEPYSSDRCRNRGAHGMGSGCQR